MREPAFPNPPRDARRTLPDDWMTDLRHILLDGAAPPDIRLEAFLDRLERTR